MSFASRRAPSASGWTARRAGHNGLKSIEGSLQSQDYARLRIGVGPLPDGIGDWADYVLAPADAEQVELITQAMPKMVEAVERWLRGEPPA